MPPGRVATELEVKLLVDRERDLDELSRLTRLGHYRLRQRAPQHLYSVYLDTRDLALSRHGVGVRVRRADATWEATVKWAGSVNGAVHRRPELNVALAGAPRFPFAAPSELRVHLTALLAGRKLVPLLVTEIDRRVIEVLDVGAQHCLVEIALDRVVLRGPHKDDPRSERYCEVEIERKQGTVEDVAAISACLQQGRRLRPSRDSKLARGLRLLCDGGVPPGPRSTALGPEDSVVTGMRKIMARHLDRLLVNDPGTRLGEDIEALHDMRVASRRLRALVRLFKSVVPARPARELSNDLRWLGHVLGTVRDVDVQLQRLEARQAAMRPAQRAAIDPYLESLRRLRAARRPAMLAELNAPRYLRLLRRLETFVRAEAAPPNARSLAGAGRRAIRKASKQLHKRAHAIGKHPSADDLHEVRILAKRLRYACEFLQPLTGSSGPRFLKRLVELQDLLGAHNDAVVATQFAHAYLEKEARPRASATARAVVRLVRANEEHAERARAGFHRAWKDFTRRRSLRQFDAMLAALRLRQGRRSGSRTSV